MLNGGALEGEVLNQTYLVEAKVGKGGMAWVYKAIHIETHEIVAIKILFSEHSDDPMTRARFLRECEILSQLSHPHIVNTLGSIENHGLLGMVLEWCDGGDLGDWVSQMERPLTIEQLQAVLFALLDGVGYAHEKGFVHRDLKLQNVLLQRRGALLVPKVADFGVAKMLDSSVTRTGALMGTLEFMSPEQLRDSKRIDHRADIYSIGMIMYYLCARYLPFNGSQHQLIMQILSYEAQPPEGAPAAIIPLIMRCLSKEEEARFPSCEALRHAWIEALGTFTSAELMAPSTGSLSQGLSHADKVLGSQDSWQAASTTDDERPAFTPTMYLEPEHKPQAERSGTGFWLALFILALFALAAVLFWSFWLA